MMAAVASALARLILSAVSRVRMLACCNSRFRVTKALAKVRDVTAATATITAILRTFALIDFLAELVNVREPM
jgi:hypothetical protein